MVCVAVEVDSLSPSLVRDGVQVGEMELEDLVVHFDCHPVRNLCAVVGCGSEPILRDDFDRVLVELEGCFTLFRGHRIGDRFRNVYVSCSTVRSHDERDYAVASNLFLPCRLGELWLDGKDELRRCDSVSSVIDAEGVRIGERLFGIGLWIRLFVLRGRCCGWSLLRESQS